MSATKNQRSVRDRACAHLGFHAAVWCDMVFEYLKNFAAKLILVPILAVLGAIFLVLFLVLPQFKLFRTPLALRTND